MRISFLHPFSFLIICLSESLWPPFLPYPCLYLQNQGNERSYKSLVYIFVTKNCIVIWAMSPSNSVSVALEIVIRAFRGCVWIGWDNWYTWLDRSSEHVICGIVRVPFLELLEKVEKFSCMENKLPWLAQPILQAMESLPTWPNSPGRLFSTFDNASFQQDE